MLTTINRKQYRHLLILSFFICITTSFSCFTPISQIFLELFSERARKNSSTSIIPDNLSWLLAVLSVKTVSPKNTVLRLTWQIETAWRSVNFNFIQRIYSSRRWHFRNIPSGVFVLILKVLVQCLYLYLCVSPVSSHFFNVINEQWGQEGGISKKG